MTETAAAPRWQLPWRLLVVAPAIVVFDVIGVRLLLHHGIWQGTFGWFAVLLTLAGVVTVLTSAIACTYAPRGRSVLTFLLACTGQVALGAALLFGLWSVLPLRFVGP